jgi:PIN domain nuclease of toxin-antitoxin system
MISRHLAASAWEIATKFRLGKLSSAQVLANNFVRNVTDAGYLLLSISVEHALRAGPSAGPPQRSFRSDACGTGYS